MEYKKFKDCKKGDIIYCVEVSNINCRLYKLRIVDFNIIYETKDNIWIEFNDSPMPFEVKKESSSWGGMMFTTEEEAKQAIQKQCSQKIKYLSELINSFANVLENINNIEFKEE